MKIRVHVEWPTGSDTVELELPDGATEEDIQSEAKDAFFNLCNYGVEVVEDTPNG